MRNPNAYGVPVYGAPSPREEVITERKPCSKHRPLCLDCGQIDDDPLSEEIMDAVRTYQKVIIDDIKFRQSMKNVHESNATDEQWEASSSHNRAVRDAADEIYGVIRKSLNIEEDDDILLVVVVVNDHFIVDRSFYGQSVKTIRSRTKMIHLSP